MPLITSLLDDATMENQMCITARVTIMWLRMLNKQIPAALPLLLVRRADGLAVQSSSRQQAGYKMHL